jgi:hypothetical protein
MTIDTEKNEYDLPMPELIARFAEHASECDPEQYMLMLDGGRHRVRLDNYVVRQTRRDGSVFIILKLTILSSRTLIPDGKAYVMFHDAHVRDRTGACRFFQTLLGTSTKEAIAEELQLGRHVGTELWVHVVSNTYSAQTGGSATLLKLNWARVRPGAPELEA